MSQRRWFTKQSRFTAICGKGSIERGLSATTGPARRNEASCIICGPEIAHSELDIAGKRDLPSMGLIGY